MSKSKTVSIVGSGPAGLMAATQLVSSGFAVQVFEQHRSLGRKILIAGKSGLNITHNIQKKSWSDFVQAPQEHLEQIFSAFSSADWIEFIESLGIETFEGTSRRYFVKGLKAAELLKAWKTFLMEQGVEFFTGFKLIDFESTTQGVQLSFENKEHAHCDAAIFAVGGGSWLDKNQDADWVKLFQKKEIQVNPFKPGNAGFYVDWSADFLKEAEGKPFKNVVLQSQEGDFPGELMVTSYGLEGTPVYNLTKAQMVYLDLKPAFTKDEILKRFKSISENLSPIRLIKKTQSLCEASLALLFHHLKNKDAYSLEELALLIKNFPLSLIQQSDLKNAISSRGGVCFSQMKTNLSLKDYPQIYLAGEMLDWHAPTGGFLIQTCVSQGSYCAKQIVG